MIRKRIRRWIKRGLPSRGRLEAKAESFWALFPSDSTPSRLATGFEFTEGPVWLGEENFLLFSDIPANQILKLTRDGQVSVFRRPSGNSNGLTRDKEGRLIACEHGNRRVTRTDRDGSIAVLADSFRGKKLNSPNDVAVRSNGDVYFTDPTYGIRPDEQQQPIQGVYRLSPKTNELTVVAEDFAAPNGLAFSPDESTLYINDSSEQRHIRAFRVESDGALSEGRVFFDMNVSERGSPDGMKVDVDGHLYCTGPGGVWVFDDAGRQLGRIVTPEKPSNCAWGDEDWRSLYITARTSVYRIRLNVQGVPVP